MVFDSQTVVHWLFVIIFVPTFLAYLKNLPLHAHTVQYYLTIIIICWKVKWILSNNPKMKPEPEGNNNCFSIIAQVIIRATAFSFILLVSSLETSRNHVAGVLKITASVL